MGKKKDLPHNPEILHQQHSELLPVAQRFCAEITNQIERLLADDGIVLGFPIQHRVKTWDSISEKLKRLEYSVQDVRKLQDLIGLRIILLFKRDTSQVCNLIEKSFKVIKQYNTDERLKEDQFGYSSIHFVVELPEEWLTVPTFTAFSKLRAEIQVRTVAQHIWAAASHTLQYKQEVSVPTSVLRSIYRVSALLETVDLEFERVLNERDHYRSKLDTSLGNVLNVDLLEKLLDELLPSENKDQNEQYSELLEDLNYFGINTSDAIKQLIEKHQEYIKHEELKWLCSAESDVYDEMINRERVKRGVYFTHIGLVRNTLEAEFGENWINYNNP
jgi:putative GTP pyrophosphokinase